MDVIDLDFIGNPENPYGYWISSDLAKNSAIVIPKEQPVEESAWDRIKNYRRANRRYLQPIR